MLRMALCAVAVVLLFLGTTLAHPRGGRRGGDRPRGKLAGKPCEVDYGNGTVITRTCGCDGETSFTCSLVSTRANRDGVQYKFCYQEQDFATEGREWTGTFKKACRVVLADGTEYTRDCRCGGTCGTEVGLTGFQVNGQDSSAFFCERPDRDGSDSSDEDEPEGPAAPEGPMDPEGPAPIEDGSCVCLREVERTSKKHMRGMTCRRTVTTNGVTEVELQRECGCEGETPATCDVTKSRTNADGQTVETSFCYQPPTENNGQFTFTGVLAGACLIESEDGAVQYQTGPCPCGSVCSSDPATAMTGFSVGGRDARAFFCARPDQDDTDADENGDDEDSSRSDRGGRGRSGRGLGGRERSDTCVCLMTEGAECTNQINAARAEREAERDECPTGPRDRQQRDRDFRGDNNRPAGNERDGELAGNQGNRPASNRGNSRPAGDAGDLDNGRGEEDRPSGRGRRGGPRG